MLSCVPELQPDLSVESVIKEFVRNNFPICLASRGCVSGKALAAGWPRGHPRLAPCGSRIREVVSDAFP